MTEPLVVDPSRLKAAGTTLGALVFPVAPSAIAVGGTDPVSAAINETLPVIESPVIDGLPAVHAALTRTGSNIVTAAGLYADTDQRLGDHLNQVQVVAVGEKRAAGQLLGATAANAADVEAADHPADGETPTPPQPTPTPAQPVVPLPGFDQISKQVGQIAATSGAVGPATQNVQTVMSAVQGATGNMGGTGGTGGAPAQLADTKTTAGQALADHAQLVDETKPDDEEREEREAPDAIAEGAAPGDQALQSTPIQPPTAGRPQMTPSGIEL